MARAILVMGGNVGEMKPRLRQAQHLINDRIGIVLHCSHVYESKAWDNETQTMFSICLEGNVAKCKFEDLIYACDFPPANVDLTTEGNNIYIVEYPSSDMADCLCTADVSFDIMNIESGEYCLYIYRGNEKGEHGDNPRLKQTIVLKQNEEIRMQYPF